MCKFLSAIVTRRGDVFCNPMIDSHEDIIEYFDIKDGKVNHIVRVEFSPVEEKDLDKIELYKFRVDEESTPKWFDEELKDKVIRKLKSILKGIIITEDRKILVEGAFIISGSKIGKVLDCRIVSLCGGTINAVCGGTINVVWDGTINAVRGGTINAVCGGTINTVWGGTINAVCGGTINAVCGGTINMVWDGTINTVRDGTIKVVRGGTIVQDFRVKK